jgi:hypothetical protein
MFVSIIAQTPDLPTEELAELHAVIQAIEYERRNDSATKQGEATT